MGPRGAALPGREEANQSSDRACEEQVVELKSGASTAVRCVCGEAVQKGRLLLLRT